MSTIATKKMNLGDPRLIKQGSILKAHPETGRLIDAFPSPGRVRAVRLLCLGMCRTGTLSTYTALAQLGYRPYHFAEVMRTPRTSLNLWVEAYRAKFLGQGKPWGREEFDKLLGEYDAILDMPSVAFAEELVAAYPDAKVLLTNRDVDSWLQSMANTFGIILPWKSWDWVAPWDPSVAGPFIEFRDVACEPVFGTYRDFGSSHSPARQKYLDHYATVRKVVPRENLLEFRVQDGWRPLCEFLGARVPEGDFPNVNDAKDIVYWHKVLWWMAAVKAVGKVVMIAGAPVTVVAAAWWWNRNR